MGLASFRQPCRDRRFGCLKGPQTYALWADGFCLLARFCVRNQARDHRAWWLGLSDGCMGFVDLGLPPSVGQGWVHECAARDIPHHHHSFTLPLPDAQKQTAYPRFAGNAAITFPLTLWSADAFAQHSQTELLTPSVYYGIISAPMAVKTGLRPRLPLAGPR